MHEGPKLARDQDVDATQCLFCGARSLESLGELRAAPFLRAAAWMAREGS